MSHLSDILFGAATSIAGIWLFQDGLRQIIDAARRPTRVSRNIVSIYDETKGPAKQEKESNAESAPELIACQCILKPSC